MQGPISRTCGVAISVNGTPVNGIIDVEVTTSNFLAAGRFRFSASLSASMPATWTGSSLLVDVQLGVDGVWADMMTGRADRLSLDPIRGIVTVEGRDLAAAFMTARTQETFENRTSSDIVTILAARRGLAAVVTPTSMPVDRSFQNNHSRTTLDQHARATTEWDLMAQLADLEGFELWVQGQSVFFSPASSGGPSFAVTPDVCIAMELTRAMDIAAGFKVTVRSWNSLGQRAISQTASSSAAGDAAATYVIVRPNMTSAEADRLAADTLMQATSHERTITLEMPGELTLLPRALLALSGTGTDFDGTYVVSQVERLLSPMHGFTQSIQARMPTWTASSIL